LFQSCNMFGINKNANKPIPRDIGKNSSIYLRIKLHEYFKSMALTKAPDNIVENTIASIRKRKPAILFEPGLLYLQWNLFLKYIGIKHPIRPVKTIENNRLDSLVSIAF